jgi:hypothetical protein
MWASARLERRKRCDLLSLLMLLPSWDYVQLELKSFPKH